jgi:hypothetical protein
MSKKTFIFLEHRPDLASKLIKKAEKPDGRQQHYTNSNEFISERAQSV